jgi:hypothetical protein
MRESWGGEAQPASLAVHAVHTVNLHPTCYDSCLVFDWIVCGWWWVAVKIVLSESDYFGLLDVGKELIPFLSYLQRQGLNLMGGDIYSLEEGEKNPPNLQQ